MLFNGNEIIVEKESGVDYTYELKEELNYVLYPQENNTFLGLKASLWIFNHTKEPTKDKGLKHYFKYKLGEKPILYKKDNADKVITLLNNRLENNGFFNCEITETTTIKKKRAKIEYNIILVNPIIVDTVYFEINSPSIEKIIKNNLSETLLKKGEVYTLNKVKEERQRIVKHLRNKGYYYFRNDFLVYYADTSIVSGKVTFKVKYKPNLSLYSKEKYSIGDVNLAINYKLNDTIPINKSVEVDGVTYTDANNVFVPKRMIRNIFLKPTVLYSDSLYRKTMRYFYGYDIINSINLNLSIKDTLNRIIDADISLSKSKTRSFVAKLTGATKTNGFSGPSAEITFANRNIFKGGEKLSLTLESGIEKQIGDETSIDYILRFAIKGELKLPNFTPGIKNLHNKSVMLPYSLVDGGVTYLKYKPTMEIWETSAGYAYRWFPKQSISWEVKPISFIYQKVFVNEVLESEEYLDLPYVPFGLENQFSLGSVATFITTNKNRSKTRNEYFFKTTMEVAGNIMFALFDNISKKQEKPYTLLGQPFSQFGRLDLDFRYYRKIGKTNKIATRLLSYIAIPYGNSIDLPFFRKYFAGGPNSLRGFQTGGIGPGTFYVEGVKPDIRVNNGDIRLEFNAEYRFKIVGSLHSVLFVDAGNVWLVREDTLRPGGKFEAKNILKTSSVSIGTGLRLDFTVIAIRLDFGIPLKYPYNNTRGDVYGDVKMIDWDRFKRKSVFHFGIDYPF